MGWLGPHYLGWLGSTTSGAGSSGSHADASLHAPDPPVASGWTDSDAGLHAADPNAADPQPEPEPSQALRWKPDGRLPPPEPSQAPRGKPYVDGAGLHAAATIGAAATDGAEASATASPEEAAAHAPAEAATATATAAATDVVPMSPLSPRSDDDGATASLEEAATAAAVEATIKAAASRIGSATGWQHLSHPWDASASWRQAGES
jgi:hypothetical protein